jgi:hypothetical protein
MGELNINEWNTVTEFDVRTRLLYFLRKTVGVSNTVTCSEMYQLSLI